MVIVLKHVYTSISFFFNDQLSAGRNFSNLRQSFGAEKKVDAFVVGTRNKFALVKCSAFPFQNFKTLFRLALWPPMLFLRQALTCIHPCWIFCDCFETLLFLASLLSITKLSAEMNFYNIQ
jgi:hypothetical protein